MEDQKTTETQAKKTKAIKLLKTPQFNFGVGAILFILILGLMAFPKYNEYKKIKADLQKVINEINGNNEQGDFLGLAGQKKKYTTEYNDTKSTLDKLNAEKQAVLDFVFPAEERINFLTQLLERYAIDHDATQDPFVLNSISFSKAQALKAIKPKPGEKAQASAPVAYEYLQINLPIQASEKNFREFIKFIQASGSLDSADFYGEEIPVPLITIESLNFTYSENPQQPSQTMVNANFILNTYIRKTANIKTKTETTTNTTENVSITE